MTELELQNAHENAVAGRCPGAYVCIVATTGYEPAKRIDICESCWIRAYSKAEAESINYEEKV